jgi:hypothetical protein
MCLNLLMKIPALAVPRGVDEVSQNIGLQRLTLENGPQAGLSGPRVCLTLGARALAIWREREATFPRFTQRMTPDKMDMETGAWARVVLMALEAA